MAKAAPRLHRDRTSRIKCNAEDPCANCKVYSKDCVYEAIQAGDADPRPRRASRPQHSTASTSTSAVLPDIDTGLDAGPASPDEHAVSTTSPQSTSHAAVDSVPDHADTPPTTVATTATTATTASAGLSDNPRVARMVDLAGTAHRVTMDALLPSLRSLASSVPLWACRDLSCPMTGSRRVSSRTRPSSASSKRSTTDWADSTLTGSTQNSGCTSSRSTGTGSTIPSL
ncbi:RNA polymerase II-specific transcription factor-like protein [Microdochium nivale]|nr:RNA polymerase II-specific transcription factor-like protein [Microdochium nivale]